MFHKGSSYNLVGVSRFGCVGLDVYVKGRFLFLTFLHGFESRR